jgi:hypothetical protein
LAAFCSAPSWHSDYWQPSYFFFLPFFFGAFLAAFFLATVCPPLKQNRAVSFEAGERSPAAPR